MRIKELVHPKHRHRMQQFVKINIQPRPKTEQKIFQESTPAPTTKPVAATEKRQLPLFMETIFKAKDFDPL